MISKSESSNSSIIYGGEGGILSPSLALLVHPKPATLRFFLAIARRSGLASNPSIIYGGEGGILSPSLALLVHPKPATLRFFLAIARRSGLASNPSIIYGGEGGIRTHVASMPTRFRVGPVMTTSVPLLLIAFGFKKPF